MSRTVPLLYGAAVALLVSAGVVLSLRTATTTPVTTRVPDGCAEVPSALVDELFPEAEPERTDRVGDDGVPYGRWQDADGTLLVELRCARVALDEVLEQQELVDRAAGSDRLELVGTEPEAVLLPVRDGVLIRQLHEGERLQRTWFVRAELDPEAARRVIDTTGPPNG